MPKISRVIFGPDPKTKATKFFHIMDVEDECTMSIIGVHFKHYIKFKRGSTERIPYRKLRAITVWFRPNLFIIKFK